VHTLTVSSQYPLILFDLNVSLEWDATYDPVYLQQLSFDLKKASQHLYDFSDGQIALGEVNIFQNADNWAVSQVVVHATNRLRPFAAQGGAVFTSTVDPQHDDITYDIGQVHMGATWNRYGAPGQNLGVDWPLILAHELGHYLLFLDDTYLGLNDDGLLIPVSTCSGSAMGDVYVPDNTEFIADSDHWNTYCADTLTNRTLSRTEWETIRLWYPWLNSPVISNTGPALMPFDFTLVSILDPLTETAALHDPTFYLDYANGAVNSSAAHAFLLREESVIDLGSPVGGQNRLLARGARPGDRLCVFDRPRAQFGCEEVELGDERLTLKHDESWMPVIQLGPVTTQTFNLQVANLPPGLDLRARLHPDVGFESSGLTLAQFHDVYSGTFLLDVPALSGHLRLWVDEPATETNPRREAIVAFAIGGNPGVLRHAGGVLRHAGGVLRHAGGVLRHAGGVLRYAGGVLRHAGAPVVSSDGQMIFFTDNPALFDVGDLYTVQTMAGLPSLPQGLTTVGQVYNLVASPNFTHTIKGSISFQYLGIDALVEGISEQEEGQLAIFFWDGNDWRALDTTLDTYHNLASSPSQGGGIYALLGPAPVGPRFELYLPLVGKRD
jgi:hypothetical protein